MKREQRTKGSKVIPPWEQYVIKVLSGEIVTGQWVRLACERHRRDISRQRTESFPYYFSASRALHILNFFDHLRHSQDWFQGHGGESFKLELWQCFILASVFGWLEWSPNRKDDPEHDTRRFTEALTCVGRKNGKTTTLSGVGLYGLLADGEQGAQIYCFATKEDQAKILWDEAVKMRAKSPVISENCKASKKAIYSEATESKFVYLGSDSETQDGLNPSFGLCDELHAHPNRKLYDVIKSGQGARRQPLLFTITTAGFAQESFCRTLEEMGEKILTRIFDDEHFFYYRAALDYDPTAKEDDRTKNDDWEDEKNWIKANPNLNVSVNIKTLREEANTAKNEPTSLNNFLTKKMNLWVSQEKRWLPMEKWRQCSHINIADTAKTAREKFLKANEGRRCWYGLDLSSNNDLSALVLAFEPIPDELDGVGNILKAGDPYTTIIPWFWLPKENIAARVKQSRVPYDVWERDNFIALTEGNQIDYMFIYAKIQELRKHFPMREMGADMYNATMLVHMLQDEKAPIFDIRQNCAMLNGPCRHLESLIMTGTLRHFNNPVLTWMASNVAVVSDSNGLIKPNKAKAAEKIDGIAATVNAFNRLLANAGAKKAPPKIYFI